MSREKLVDARGALGEPVHVVLKILILVLLYHGVKPVAKVMQEDAKDGYATQGVALGTGEQALAAILRGFSVIVKAYSHYFFPCAFSSWRAASLSLS